MSLEVEQLELLIQQGEKLRSSLYVVNKQLNGGSEKPLQSKEIISLCKALMEGKPKEMVTFPHLSYDDITSYGPKMRYSFCVLNHFVEFQKKTIKVLTDVCSESHIFDLSWNYVFVMPVMRLFTNYVRLHLFVNSIPDIEKVPYVYGYCFSKVAKTDSETSELLSFFLKERDNYRLLESELHILKEHFVGMFKSIVPIIDRLLKSGKQFTWNLLNLQDNPMALAKNSSFFKPEYIVMIHMNEICECFICFCLMNLDVLSSVVQFSDVMRLLAAYCNTFQLYGDFRIELRRIFEDVRKIRGKRSDDISCLDRSRDTAKQILPDREFIIRKLTMILQDYNNGFSQDPTILQSKLVIVMSILGYANFELMTYFAQYTKDIDPSLLELLHIVMKVVIFGIRNTEQTARFLVYNFREFDSPLLFSKIHSFTMPQSDYQRFMLMIDAFNSLDIEMFDEGTKYDLTGMRVNIMREMATFNRFSTSHGVMHLAPLFNLISSIFFRVDLFVNVESLFTRIVPIQYFWCFKESFMSMVKQNNHKQSGLTVSLLAVAHFYSNDLNTINEWPEFSGFIKDHVNQISDIICENMLTWARSLQFNEMKEFRNQTSISSLLNRKEDNGTKDKPRTFSDVPIGDESLLKNRRLFTPSYEKLECLVECMTNARQMGAIQVFGEKYVIIDEFMTKLSRLLLAFFESGEVTNPFEIVSQMGSASIILQSAMSAAQVNPSEFIAKSKAELQSVKIDIDNSTIKINGPLGHFCNTFKDQYSDFFKGSLMETFYSMTAQAFLSNGNSKSSQSHFFASRSALRTLHSIIQTPGMVAIDFAGANTILMLLNQLEPIMSKYLYQNGTPEFLNNPFVITESPQIIKILCQIGAIQKFRNLLKQSIGVSIQNDSNFGFMNPKVNPHEDLLMNSIIGDHPIIGAFQNELFNSFIGALFASPYWLNLNYNAQHDGFLDNSHLIVGFFDIISGSVMSKNLQFDRQKKYSDIFTQCYKSIISGEELNRARNKRAKWPKMGMILLLDHMIKNSRYADYSLLEPVISYQIIRSIYTQFLREIKTDEGKK